MRHFFMVLCLVSAAGILSAQTIKLTQSSGQAPMIDGQMSANEYSQSVKLGGGMTVSAFLSKDNILYIALQSPNKGWIGLGFGTDKMNNARILIASVVNGKQTVSEQMGKGHSHSDGMSAFFKSAEYKVVEGKDGTTFEISIPVADISSLMQNGSLKMIGASANNDSFTAGHGGGRHSFTIQIN